MKKIIQAACETVENTPHFDNKRNVAIAFSEFFQKLGGKKLAEKFEKAKIEKALKKSCVEFKIS